MATAREYPANRTRVDERWQPAFDAFISTGKLDPEFREQLDRDPELKRAVDETFRTQVEALAGIGRALQSRDPRISSQGAGIVARRWNEEEEAEALAGAFIRLIEKPAPRRRGLVQEAMSLVRDSVERVPAGIASAMRGLADPAPALRAKKSLGTLSRRSRAQEAGDI
jgi:hypothetical protein